ncbi:MAG: bifunctional folylpolyglutamate synthase/dihydrofolate synthase [Acidimicrobiia bacterium]
MSWLYGRLDLERSPDARRGTPTLERTRRLLRLLGDPQDDYPVISVTGTNGKTSTSRILAALLEGFGLSVGVHTSPHLEKVNERLARAGEAIPDHELVEVLSSVALAEDHIREEDCGAEALPSYFEVLTAAAYRWFADLAVQVTVAEVGLGGRWDATNVADAAMAVVTNVAVDHVEYLGPSRASIAAEKAGIVKPGCVLILGETDPELTGLFLAAPPSRVLLRERDFGVLRSRPIPEGRVVDLFTPGAVYSDLHLSLHGAFQADNAALALAAAEAFLGDRELDRSAVSRAFAGLRSPGRVEIIHGRPLILLDGAHNPAGAAALGATLEEEFDHGSRTLVVGMLEGRDPEAMLGALGVERVDRLVC